MAGKGNINNLNFGIILDDVEFKAKVKENIELAKELNTSLSNALKIKKSATSIRNLTSYIDKLKTRKKALETSTKALTAAEEQELAVVKELVKYYTALEKASSKASTRGNIVATTKSQLSEERVMRGHLKTAIEQERLERERLKTAIEQERLARAKASTANVTTRRDRAVTQEAIENERLARAKAQAALAELRLTRETKKANRHFLSQSKLVKNLRMMLLSVASIGVFKRIIQSLVSITAEFEAQKVALKSILSDSIRVEALYNKLQGLAVVSPFQFSDLITFTKQLAAYSIPLEDLYDTVSMLADVSSGLGVGMDRLILAYGQIRSASVLRGQELRQLTEAGIPAVELLRKKFEELGETGITTADVFDKISNRLVPFEMIEEIFKDLTSSGGMFYKMQERYAETLKGKISNLVDAYQMMMSEIGGMSSGVIVNVVDSLRAVIDNYDKFAKAVKVFAISMGLASAAILLYRKRVGILNVLHGDASIKATKLYKAIAKHPYATIAVAVAGLVTWIYRLITATTEYEDLQKSLNDTWKEYSATLRSDLVTIQSLFKQLKAFQKGTESYNEVMDTLMSRYGSYLNEQSRELIQTGQLAKAYRSLALNIEEANKERFKEQDMEALKKYQTEMYGRVQTSRDNVNRLLAQESKNKANVVAALDMYMRGDSLEDVFKMLYPNDKKVYTYDEEELKNRILNSFRAEDDNLTGWEKFITFIMGNPDRTSTGELYPVQSLFRGQLEEARNTMIEVERYTDETIKRITLWWGNGSGSGKTDPPPLSKWQNAVNEYLKNLSDVTKSSIWTTSATKNNDYDKYIDDMRSAYKQIEGQIKDAGIYGNKDTLNKERDMLEGLARVLGISLVEDTAGRAKTSDDGLDSLRVQVQWLKELWKQYEKLSEYADDNTLTKIFSNQYANLANILPQLDQTLRDNLFKDFKFADALESMAKKVEKIGTDSAKSLAEQIRREIGGDWADKFANVMKSLRDYNEFIKEWEGEDFNIGGSGAVFDINKIINEYKNKLTDLENKRKKAEVEVGALKKKNGEEWYDDEMTRITTLYEKNKEYEKALAKEKLIRVAEKYTNELIDNENAEYAKDKNRAKNDRILTKGYNKATLGELSHSIKNLQALKDELSENGTITEEMKQTLTQLGIPVDEFNDSIQQMLDVEIDKQIKERNERIVAFVSQAINMISRLGSSIKALAQDIDDVELEEFGDALEKTSSTISSVMQGFSQGGWIGAIIALGVSIIDFIVEGIAEAQRFKKALRDASDEYSKLLTEKIHEQNDTIFGENKFSNMRHDLTEYTKAIEKYNEAVSKITQNRFTKWNKRYSGEKHNALDTLANVSKPGLDGSFFMNEGVLDMEKVKLYYDITKKEIPKKQRELIKELIDNYEELEEYHAYMAEYLESLFGNLAASISDALLQGWRDTFSTVEDDAKRLQDVFYKLGESIVQSIVQSLITDKILNKYNALLEQLYSDYNTTNDLNAFLSGLDSLFASLKDDIDEMVPVIENVYDFAEHRNIIPREDTDSSSDTLQGSLTEDTLNRVLNLANAMRAEQFRQGGLLDSINGRVMDIAALCGQSREDYLNHLSAISANTANTVNRLETIITLWNNATTGSTSSGAMKVRIMN